MKDSKKIILAIVTTILIIAIVVTGTYAYWQWQSSDEQKTTVGFTVTADGMGATFVGSGTMTANYLEPSACGNGIKQAIKIDYYNATPYPATISVDLVATKFAIRSTSYKPTTDNLSYLHWAITKSNSCTDPANTSAGRTGIANDSTVSPATSDNFGEFYNTFSTATSSIKPTIASISFVVPGNTGSESAKQSTTYYLYVWLDKNYQHTNTGSVNSDPLQGLSFSLQWQNAFMEQKEA